MRILSAVFAVLAACTAASALSPQQVLVVANSSSKDSLALAEFYMTQRGIPKGNLVTAKCTEAYEMTRAEYESQLRLPLKEIILARPGEIRCIALMYGVPVRVAAPPSFDEAASKRALYRMAICAKLAATIGKDFPANPGDDLKPLAKLFSSPLPLPKDPLPKAEDLRKEINIVLAERQVQVRKIDDAAKRKLAWRQLMAVYQDTFGVSGLADYVELEKPDGAPPLDDLKKQLAALQEQGKGISRMELKDRVAFVDQLSGSFAVATMPDQQPTGPAGILKMMDAAVDSELPLLLSEYRLEGPLMNPLKFDAHKIKAPPTIMACRIDGPDLDTCKRVVTDSIAAEQKGLKGVFYIDAGGTHPTDDSLRKAYAEYDKHLQTLGAFLKDSTSQKVVLDKRPELFGPGECPDAALYVGWYSLQKYIPAFKWQQGAVGWHVASFEAMRLRDATCNDWCPRMLKDGVAATLGAVNEPLLGSFPLPEDFFPLLLTGKWTVAECYWRTTPTVSWRVTLICDPLYNPFGTNPQVKASAIRAELLPDSGV